MSVDASIRATKRKLDDAFQTLDDITVHSSSAPPSTPLLKRAHTSSSSIYSTLSKYGIKSRQQLSHNDSAHTKNTPHLTAILSRVASKAKKATTVSRSSTNRDLSTSTRVEYRPSSTPSFLDRLATYTLSNYGNKPSPIDAVAASKAGWTNNGKDRLYCSICGTSWVLAGRSGLKPDVASVLVEKQRLGLVANHKSGCPWKAHQCDDSIYQIPHQSPKATVDRIRVNATTLQPMLEHVPLKHPLTETQLSALLAAVTAQHETSREVEEGESAPSQDFHNAVVVSLFGWEPISDRSRTLSSASISGSVSRLPTMPSSPSFSRSHSHSVTAASLSSHSLMQVASSKALNKDTSLLQCSLCHRRVGLWSFKPSSTTTQPRSFDVLHEHRSFCPYVVKSTTAQPSIPESSNGADVTREGWKEMLMACIAHGRHVANPLFAQSSSASDSSVLEGMLQNAKVHGSMKILQYVKALLG